ncbi:hypothetical protein RR48_02359 [Papilio machaon]|uniref:Uncharacterized protein n=1 Tax=Papilio machaon TaxID=76193 RepID=A0A0N1I8T1_PAPMA|nr:hypothetical protein RR48_02359 [Papilio machaon]
MSKSAHVVDGEASESDSEIEIAKSPNKLTFSCKVGMGRGRFGSAEDTKEGEISFFCAFSPLLIKESKLPSPSDTDLDSPLHVSMSPQSPTKMYNSLLHQKLCMYYLPCSRECNVSLRATLEGLLRHTTDISVEKLTTTDKMLLSVQMNNIYWTLLHNADRSIE